MDERLIEAVGAFYQVSSDEELNQVLQTYPELLTQEAEINTIFEFGIAQAYEANEIEQAEFFAHRRQILKKTQLMVFVKQAQTSEQHYLRTGDRNSLDKAIAAWEHILQHPEFEKMEVDFKLSILNDSAVTYLHRYWARDQLTDLNTALKVWESVVANTPPDSPDLPSYLNNLGVGLTERYSRLGELADLQTGIVAFQQAIDKTPPKSPDLPLRLDNLGTGLRDRYSRLGELADLQAGIVAHQQAIEKTPPDSPDFRRYLNNLGNGLTESYLRLGELADLQAGIQAYQQAIEKTPPDSPDLPRWLNNLGNGLTDRYSRLGELADLQAGIQAYQQAIEKTPPDSPNFPRYLNNLGDGLTDRYLRLGELEDLQEGIAAIQQAIEKTPSDSPHLPSYLNNLGNGLSNRYLCLGKLEDLHEGIAAIQRAIEKTPSDSPYLTSYLNNLSGRLRNRYWRLGNLADLQEGIMVCQQVIKKVPPDSPNLPSYLNNLGEWLRNRYSRLGELEDLQEGIEAIQQAIKKTPTDSPYLPSYLNNLGVGLIDRYLRLGKLADSEAGILAYQQAIEKTPPDSPDLPYLLNNLGTGLSNRYSRLGELADLQAGIAAYQQTIEKIPIDFLYLPTLLNNLGNGLSNRYSCLGESADLQAGIDAYQQAVKLGEKDSIANWLMSSRTWLNWAFERDSWAEIEKSYPALQKASKQLVEKQLLREHQESFLQDTQGIAVKVAYARIQTGQLAEAVEALEQGVARLLSSALARSDADLTQLQQDNSELYERYQQQLKAIKTAQHFYQNAPESLREKAQSDWQTAEKQFNELLTEIRQLQGHKNFLLIATDINMVKQVSQQQPLIYIFATEKGGYALTIFQGEIQAIALPELIQATLSEKINSYFQAYDKRGENWFNAIEAMTTWLYQAIMQPVLQNIPKQSQITLIPIGALNLLPLHAAAYLTADNQRRYVLDDYTINYAPNALSLQTAHKRAKLPAHKLLAINEPKPQPIKIKPLPSCAVEIQAIQRHFAQKDISIFAYENATLKAVKNALNNDYSVLHFSCHGGVDEDEPLNPLKRGLVMANKKILTVQDFLNAKLNARLVSLSACETGIIGIKQMEEVVGLPTSLLQAGVAGVVASLWSVADLSTMLLMAQFYHRWFNEYPDNPAEALRLAQIWVRDAKPREKTAFLKTFLPENEAKAIREKMGASDYSHPFFWAAFNYTGI